uniref:Uncharacterized protein n=1 Tax=Chrysemys picta bellii TaxID=8478 RepID=A0A8C3H766_CHRPI
CQVLYSLSLPAHPKDSAGRIGIIMPTGELSPLCGQQRDLGSNHSLSPGLQRGSVRGALPSPTGPAERAQAAPGHHPGRTRSVKPEPGGCRSPPQ